MNNVVQRADILMAMTQLLLRFLASHIFSIDLYSYHRQRPRLDNNEKLYLFFASMISVDEISSHPFVIMIPSACPKIQPQRPQWKSAAATPRIPL